MSQFGKKLKDANKLWKSAKTRAAESGGSRYQEYDDGRYMARITNAKIGESQSSGRAQVVWTFTFEEGQYEKMNKLDFSGLETEQNLYYLALRLNQLGYEPPEDLQDLEDILEDVNKTKPLCKINLKTKGEFQNVYIDKVFASGQEESGEETEDDEDDVPTPPAKGKGKDAAKAKAAPPEEEEEDEDDDEEDEDDAPAAEEEEDEEEEAEDDEAEDDDSVELSVGMAVTVETSKGSVSGKVIEILEAEGKARVKTEDGKTLRVPIENLAVPDEVPEEPVAPPKKKGKK